MTEQMPWPDVAVPENHADVLSAWLHIHQAVEAVQAEMSARLEATGDVTMQEHNALFRLATAPDRRLSMLRLAEALATSPSGATRVVERLVKRGWVVREQPPDNRRQTDAVLTDAGREALLRRTRPAYHRVLTDCVGDVLTPDDLTHLRHLGRKLLEARHHYNPSWFDVHFP